MPSLSDILHYLNIHFCWILIIIGIVVILIILWRIFEWSSFVEKGECPKCGKWDYLHFTWRGFTKVCFACMPGNGICSECGELKSVHKHKTPTGKVNVCWDCCKIERHRWF